jgi:hypothetical protein
MKMSYRRLSSKNKKEKQRYKLTGIVDGVNIRITNISRRRFSIYELDGWIPTDAVRPFLSVDSEKTMKLSIADQDAFGLTES